MTAPLPLSFILVLRLPIIPFFPLSLHDALPISRDGVVVTENLDISGLRRYKDDVTEVREGYECGKNLGSFNDLQVGDRKSTRLNSSHVAISYAVFCLKKQKHKLDCVWNSHLSSV